MGFQHHHFPNRRYRVLISVALQSCVRTHISIHSLHKCEHRRSAGYYTKNKRNKVSFTFAIINNQIALENMRDDDGESSDSNSYNESRLLLHIFVFSLSWSECVCSACACAFSSLLHFNHKLFQRVSFHFFSTSFFFVIPFQLLFFLSVFFSFREWHVWT